MRIPFLIIICIILVYCDGGLAPPELLTGISGTLYFAGTWPPADSLNNLLLFASSIWPLDSAKVVNGLLKNPSTIFVYPGLNDHLPYYVDSIRYTFPLDPGTYRYIGVIQQIKSDFLINGIRVFRVVGFFKDSSDSSQPGVVVVNNVEVVSGINFTVDFHNPPAQPF
jgi:hypothetical protein